MALSKLTGLFSGGGNVPVPGVSSGGSSSGSFSARLANKQAAEENKRRWEIQQAQAAEQRAYNRSRMAKSDARASAMHGANMTNAGLLTDQRQHAIDRQDIVDAQNDFKYGQATRVGDVNLEVANNKLDDIEANREAQAIADQVLLEDDVEKTKVIEQMATEAMPTNQVAEVLKYGLSAENIDDGAGIAFDPGSDPVLASIKEKMMMGGGQFVPAADEAGMTKSEIRTSRAITAKNNKGIGAYQEDLSKEYTDRFDSLRKEYGKEIVDQYGGRFNVLKKGTVPKSIAEMKTQFREIARKRAPDNTQAQAKMVKILNDANIKDQKSLLKEHADRSAAFKISTSKNAVSAKANIAKDESKANIQVAKTENETNKNMRDSYKAGIKELPAGKIKASALRALAKGDWARLDSIFKNQ